MDQNIISGSIPSSDITEKQKNLRRLLAPRHVAFVGGQSNAPAIDMLRMAGFEGEIWPVHPTHRELNGLPVFASIADLPESPDAAFLNVAARTTIEIVEQLRERGAGGAICYSAGYAELGEKGRGAQQQLVTAAGNLALVGPNANGILNYLDKLALWPAKSHTPHAAGNGIAIISSSGGILFNYAINQRSLKAAVMIATGNQAVLTFTDYIEYLLGDGRVTAIGLIAEDVGDPVRFANAIAQANDREIPIVALKTGRSEMSAELAATHSGAMVARNDMIEALFARAGVVSVRSLPEFDETLKMLTVPRAARGRRTALLTINGGEKALALDAAAGMAIEFPPPSPSKIEELRKQIPEFATVSNPFDFNPHYTGTNVLAMDNESSLARCFETFLDDGIDIAILLVSIRSSPDGSPTLREGLLNPTIDAFTRVCEKLDITGVVAATMPEHLPYKQREQLIEHGIAPLMGLNEALQAVNHAILWQEWKARNRHIDRRLPEDPMPPPTGNVVDEAEAKAALASFGLPVPRSQIVSGPRDAAMAADEIGYPAVLKVLKPVFAHKMQQGAVALYLNSSEQVFAAAEAMCAKLKEGGHEIQQMIIERMISNTKLEVILGIKYEPRFGHILILGYGGIHAEDIAHPEVLLLPAGDIALRNFVFSAQVMRREAHSTKEAVFSAARALAEYCASNRKRLRELDVNPLIIDRDGIVTAVDALILQS